MTYKELIESLQRYLEEDPALADLNVYTNYFHTAVTVEDKPFTLAIVDIDSDDIATYSAYPENKVSDFNTDLEDEQPSVILGMFR